MAMKIAAVLIYGFFGWSIFYFCRTEVNESPSISLFTVAFVLLQVAALRLSWDLYQNLLALGLLLLLLGSFRGLSGSRRTLSLVILAGLIMVTHQFVTVFLFMLGGGLFVWALLKHETPRKTPAILAIIGLFALGLVSCLLIFPTTVYTITTAAHSEGLFSASVAVALGVLLAALYLPAIVPAVVGFRKIRSLVVWGSEVCLILLMSALGFPYLTAFMDRWALMLAIPVGVMGALGLVAIARRLVNLAERCSLARQSRRLTQGIVLLALLVPYGGLALEFMTSPIAHPYWYFDNPALWRVGSSGLPATMLHNTMPFEDEPDVVAALQWLNHVMTSSDVLLTHTAFYGWALLYLRWDLPIINYGGNNPNQAAVWGREEGFHREYVIWFIPGYGWDAPDPNFSHWALAFKDGPIVIYFQS
jgi:hypothetical protein